MCWQRHFNFKNLVVCLHVYCGCLVWERECYQQFRNIPKAEPLLSSPSKFHVSKLVEDQFAKQ